MSTQGAGDVPAAGERARIVALLDGAMVQAAMARLGDAREVVPVDLHIAFMRPTAGSLAVEGRASGGGRSVCFCEATLTDAGGEVAARAMGTFRLREPSHA